MSSVVRQVFWCPECGRVKDGKPEHRYGPEKARQLFWCHSYADHYTGGRHKMRPIAIYTPEPSNV